MGASYIYSTLGLRLGLELAFLNRGLYALAMCERRTSSYHLPRHLDLCVCFQLRERLRTHFIVASVAPPYVLTMLFQFPKVNVYRLHGLPLRSWRH